MAGDVIRPGYIPAGFFSLMNELVSPALAHYGFAQADDKGNEYWCGRTYGKDSQFIRFEINAHPLDSPIHGNVVLWLGGLRDADRDWKALTIRELAGDSGSTAGSYPVDGETVNGFVGRALADLAAVGRPFLEGQIEDFSAHLAKKQAHITDERKLRKDKATGRGQLPRPQNP